MGAEGRIPLFDNVKWLLIALVVVGHYIDGDGTADFRSMRALFVFIYAFHMPLFLFISGLFFKKKNCLEKGKVISFICLGFLLKIVSLSISLLFGRNAAFSLLSDAGVSWFMFALAAYYVICWVLKDVDQRLVLLLSVLLSLAVGYDTSVGDFLYLSRIIVFFPFFWLGRCLDPDVVADFCRKPALRVFAVLCLSAFVALCLFDTSDIYAYRSMFTGRNSYAGIAAIQDCSWVNRLIAYAVSLLVGLSVLSIVPNVHIPIVTGFGKRTLQVFFWHHIVLDAMRFAGIQAAVQWCFPDIWPYLFIVLAVCVTLVLSLSPFGVPLKPLTSLQSGRILPKAGD